MSFVGNMILDSRLVTMMAIVVLLSHFSSAELTMNDLPPDLLSKADTVVTESKKNAKDENYSSCDICRKLVKSFKRGEYDTTRGKFEGGDAHWEQSKGVSYKDSEIRLIEIQERLCNDVSSGQDKCLHLAEEVEIDIESWWKGSRKEGVTLDQFLCVNLRKFCCPYNLFGPECSPCSCPADPTFQGTCNGNGTRTGTGKCLCKPAYTGEECTECDKGFIKSSSDSIVCEPCDKSCKGHCRQKGPKGCEVCKDGYSWAIDVGCFDIDECLELGYNPCSKGTFCVNTEGSHNCFNCDKGCDGCTGDGPDMCVQCAQGYSLKNGYCQSNKANSKDRELEKSRFFTYFGLCLCTCIIFRNNIYIASAIGLLVAIYITLAEYTVEMKGNGFEGAIENALKGVFGATN